MQNARTNQETEMNGQERSMNTPHLALHSSRKTRRPIIPLLSRFQQLSDHRHAYGKATEPVGNRGMSA
jgi:hypothetical protein